MQPLNQSERRKAFINFLLLFVVTVTIIIAVVFFSIQVPFSYNKQLRQELSLREGERDLTLNFQAEMRNTVSLLKTLDSKEVQPEVINVQVNEKLNKMNVLIKGAPDAQKTFYLSVIEHLAILKNAKNDLKDLNNREKITAELRQQIQQLKADLHQKDIQILSYQTQLRQMQ